MIEVKKQISDSKFPYEHVKGVERLLRKMQMDCQDEVEQMCYRIKKSISIGDVKESVLCKSMLNPIGVNHNGKIDELLSKDQSKIVNPIKKIYVQELAYYRLMIEGILMPTEIRTVEPKITIDLHFCKSNVCLDVFMDIMPFQKYVVVKIPE